jgi:hypothetical protein
MSTNADCDAKVSLLDARGRIGVLYKGEIYNVTIRKES